MHLTQACTELHLAGKRFERLRDFDQLVNLEVLWINDNRLRFIDGLEHNFRIKELYAHNNHICTLKVHQIDDLYMFSEAYVVITFIFVINLN